MPGPGTGPTISVMRLTTNTQVSVDGVAQGNGGRDENVAGVFERGGWSSPLFDDEAMSFVIEGYQQADAFLFGRWTYDLFAGYWSGVDPSGNEISAALNSRPKYVMSTTLTDPGWADTTVLSGDLVAAVRELKAKPGRELQVPGSLSVVRWLLAHELVDELTLYVVPVIVGQGARLFPETGPDIALDLIESRTFPKGIAMQVYQPTGRPQYA